MRRLKEISFYPYARAPVLGAAFGILLVLGAIIAGSNGFLAFFSLEGLLIVGGGVMAVAFMSYPSDEVHKALQAISNMLKEPAVTHNDLHSNVINIIKCAKLVKDKGMRALEASIANSGIVDPVVRYGLNMVVSEYPPEDVRSMLSTATEASYERDIVPAEILDSMASHAPAFGMVGTLVGMVTMLCHLDGDMTGIGSSLAVAFLSTLYGVISARMIYMPAAAKVRQEAEKTRYRNQLLTEGLVMLVVNKPTMYIQDRLNSYLRPETHNYFNVFARQDARPQLKATAA